MIKNCSVCKKEKSIDDFNNNKNYKDGKFPYCKSCRKEERKKNTYERPTNGIKVCVGCNETKDISNFNSDCRNPSGLQTYCKLCAKGKSKIWASSFEGHIKKIYNDIVQNCKKKSKDIKVEINIDDIKEQYEKQNGKCALSGLKMTYEVNDDSEQHINNKLNISVDRIDSNKNYSKDNIQLVCSIINRMKVDLTTDKFFEICKEIAINN